VTQANGNTAQQPAGRSALLPRAVLVTVCLLLGAAGIGRASRSEATPPRESFSTFPLRLGAWEGQSADRFDQRVLTVLGVDEYINRVYQAPGRPPVGLYIGFYQSQREGDTMHSPLNCLPGAGWQPTSTKRVSLAVASSPSPGAPTRTVVVNRVVILKGLEKQVVLYWYQSHGRVIASEYWGKVYTVLDAIRLNRTDAAMIRIIAPVAHGEDAGAAEAEASRSSIEFAQSVFPLLGRYLPE
jgi:EpsI family protein